MPPHHNQHIEGAAVFDYIPLDMLGYGSGWAIVCLLVIWLYRALSTGKLATRHELERIEHDRDEWRTESRLKDQTITELNDQKSMLMRDLIPVLDRVLDAMHGNTRNREVD